MARPSEFTQDIADKICEGLAMGKSLRTVCISEDMPHISTIFNWFRTQKGFIEQYARAKEESADADLEAMEDIGDIAIQEAKIVDPKAANAVVSAYKLKADNIKWGMSKKKPRKYGDKVDVTSDGKAIEGNTIILKDFSGTKTDSK